MDGWVGGREGGRERASERANKQLVEGGFREGGHALCRKINQLGINSLETRINRKAACQCGCLCLVDTNGSIPVLKLGKNFSPDPSLPSQRDLGSGLSP